MDRKLLENILNEFPNIQNDEEFYRDISGIMEPIETGEFVYTDLSYADFLKSKGILKLNKIPRPNQTEIEIKDRAFALSLGKYLVINKDLMEEEVDLDNKIIRLNSIPSNPDNVVDSISPFDGNLEDLRKRDIYDEREGDDEGHLYSVHIHKHPTEHYTYHWMKPVPSDIFIMPRLDERDEDRPVRKLVSHERAVQLDNLLKADPTFRASSQLTPQELEHYLYAGFTNLGSTLKVDDKDTKETKPGQPEKSSDETSPHRLFFPVKSSHPQGGYVRITRPHQIKPEHFPWDEADDDDTVIRAMAAAEKLYERATDSKGATLTLEDITAFLKRYVGNSNAQAIADRYAGDTRSAKKTRELIEQIKQEPIFGVAPTSEKKQKHESEYHKGISNLLRDLKKNKANLKGPADLFDPNILRPFFMLRGGSTYRLPIRTLEGANNREDSRYHRAIRSMSKMSEQEYPTGKISDSAVNHLTRHIENILPRYKISLQRKIAEGNPEEISKIKTDHDKIVLTYLSRFLGTRLGGGDEKVDKEGAVGLSTITRENIVPDEKDPENGTLRLVFRGKKGTLADIPIRDKYLKSLIFDQLKYVDQIKTSEGKITSPDDLLFSAAPDFYHQLRDRKSSPLFDIINNLGLEKLTGYSFRHYRGTEVSIKSAQEEAKQKVKDILHTELRKLNPVDRMARIRQIAGNLERFVSDLDLHNSRIVDRINLELSHSPGSTSWTSYASPKFIKAAYRVGLRKYLTLLYNEAKNAKPQ